MDLHSLDGKWTNNIVITVEDNIKLEIILHLRKIVNAESSSVLEQLITDYNTENNYDPISKTNVNDILYLISLYIEKVKDTDRDDIIQLFNDILIEMKSGMCPQGRSTRLYQLLLCLSY